MAEFNDQQVADLEQIRDLLILHYRVTDRRNAPWQSDPMPISDSLAQPEATHRSSRLSRPTIIVHIQPPTPRLRFDFYGRWL